MKKSYFLIILIFTVIFLSSCQKNQIVNDVYNLKGIAFSLQDYHPDTLIYSLNESIIRQDNETLKSYNMDGSLKWNLTLSSLKIIYKLDQALLVDYSELGNYYVARIDENGNETWRRQKELTYSTNIYKTSDYYYFLTGDYNQLCKLDSEGNIIYEKGPFEVLKILNLFDDGSILIQNGEDSIIKYANDGVEIYHFFPITFDLENGIYVSGNNEIIHYNLDGVALAHYDIGAGIGVIYDGSEHIVILGEEFNQIYIYIYNKSDGSLVKKMGPYEKNEYLQYNPFRMINPNLKDAFAYINQGNYYILFDANGDVIKDINIPLEWINNTYQLDDCFFMYSMNTHTNNLEFHFFSKSGDDHIASYVFNDFPYATSDNGILYSYVSKDSFYLKRFNKSGELVLDKKINIRLPLNHLILNDSNYIICSDDEITSIKFKTGKVTYKLSIKGEVIDCYDLKNGNLAYVSQNGAGDKYLTILNDKGKNIYHKKISSYHMQEYLVKNTYDGIFTGYIVSKDNLEKITFTYYGPDQDEKNIYSF